MIAEESTVQLELTLTLPASLGPRKRKTRDYYVTTSYVGSSAASRGATPPGGALVRSGGLAWLRTAALELLTEAEVEAETHAARTGTIALFTSASLLAELAEVLQHPKFAQRLARANVSPHTLVVGYAALARLVVPAPIGPVVEADPDDDAVLACAVAARAEVVRSLSQGTGSFSPWSHTRESPSSQQHQLMARLTS